MDDTPYVNDGADASLRKTVSLLNKIEAKTGSATITGPVTVTNEVEVTNSSGSPIPVSGTVTANTGLTQPLTDAQLRATAVPVNESLIVNQGSLFLYSTTGTYGAFDCGADADYVVFNRIGGGGGFTQKLEFSTTSDFATVYDTLSGGFAIFSEKFITNTNDINSQAPTNISLASTDGGSYVVNLRRLSTYGGNENLKVRYVRLVMSGGGGGAFGGKFTSFRSKTSDAFNMNAAPHKTLISGIVDINSAKRPLPVTDNEGSLTVDGTFWQATQPVSLASAPVTPVTDNGGSLTVDGTVTVNDMTSGNAKTKIVDSTGADVSYIPAGTAGTPSASVLSVQGISGGTSLPISGTVDTGLTQPLTDAQLRLTAVPVSGTFFQGTQPVSLASVPSHDVTGSGSFTAAQATAANLNATVVGSGSFTAAQATASSLKAQAQILDSAGALLTYGSTGVAGSPSSDVITVQGASAGTALNTKILNSSGTAVTYAETGTYGSPSVDVLSVQNPQGVTATITTFTSTTASTSLVAAGSTRKALTVYNSGAGDLYISPTAVCTTTNFQLKLSSGDFWECPPSQVLLSHTGVFATSGTAYITSLT